MLEAAEANRFQDEEHLNYLHGSTDVEHRRPYSVGDTDPEDHADLGRYMHGSESVRQPMHRWYQMLEELEYTEAQRKEQLSQHSLHH